MPRCLFGQGFSPLFLSPFEAEAQVGSQARGARPLGDLLQ
jgi:hypothetical protein